MSAVNNRAITLKAAVELLLVPFLWGKLPVNDLCIYLSLEAKRNIVFFNFVLTSAEENHMYYSDNWPRDFRSISQSQYHTQQFFSSTCHTLTYLRHYPKKVSIEFSLAFSVRFSIPFVRPKFPASHKSTMARNGPKWRASNFVE